MALALRARAILLSSKNVYYIYIYITYTQRWSPIIFWLSKFVYRRLLDSYHRSFCYQAGALV